MLDTEQLIEQLRLQGRSLAHAARQADPQAGVPSCPGWTVTPVLGHTTKAPHWASWSLGGGDPGGFEYQRPEPAQLGAEYDAGLDALVSALVQAPDDLAVHTLWPAGSARHFWARRQAHETAIHRVDAELAAGYGVGEFDAEFAVDGVDELVIGMAGEQFRAPGLDGSRTIALTPLDANASWTVRVSASGAVSRREPTDQPDLAVFGLAGDLYRWVWNRAADDEVSLRGDLTLADRWHHGFTVGARRPDSTG